MQVVEKKAEHWWWMPYVAAMGQCLNGNKERLSDVVRELRKEGKPFWSQRFVYGKSVESQVVQDRVDGLLHQAAVRPRHRSGQNLRSCGALVDSTANTVSS